MKLLPLLGKQLKDDEIIEILEGLNIDVIYEFDRLHENQPDIYWAASKPEGFQFSFDEKQKLEVVFLHITSSDGYAAFSQLDCDIPFFASKQEVMAFGETQRLELAKGNADFQGISREWVRLGFATHSIHYEFHAGHLALVTISRKDEPPA
jgi:hypothetical protein